MTDLFLQAFGAVLASSIGTTNTKLILIFHGRAVQHTANDVIPDAGQIADATTTNEHDGVLLKIVTFTRDVRIHLFMVCKPYPGNFTHC